MMPVTWMILAILMVLLVGYAAGRRQGIRRGRYMGNAESRIRLRQESLREGVCKICDRTFHSF